VAPALFVAGLGLVSSSPLTNVILAGGADR